MTKDVIELAREAGLVPASLFVGVREWQKTALAKFAALVAARERERCAQVCEAMHEEDRPGDYAYAIRYLNTEGEGLDATTAQKGGE